jgi:uncharacterized membrane protein
MDENTALLLVILSLVLVIFYLYLASIEKALSALGLTKAEVSAILFLTLFLGWITIPVFPYNGWWVGMSLGGGVIPLAISIYMLKSKRVGLAEGSIGIIIVTYISYFITRPVEGVGIVADIPIAFAPAIAAGLFSLSVFWMHIGKAAPLAYTSGVIGTIIGADLLHLGEVLEFEAPSDGMAILSIGGANIFDMVYITGLVAVLIAVFVLWLKRKQQNIGAAAAYHDWQQGAEGLPYAKDMTPEPTLFKTTSRPPKEAQAAPERELKRSQ